MNTFEVIVSIAAGIIILAEAYDKFFGNDKKEVNNRLSAVEGVCAENTKDITVIKQEVMESKRERKLMYKGILASLKGLQEQGCNGTVSGEIKEMDDFLMDAAHD